MIDRRMLVSAMPAAFAVVACPVPAIAADTGGVDRADVTEMVVAAYRAFLEAQNARDLQAVRAALWDSPDFLWVSDGRPFWGPDALVERMGQFQKAEVWHVTPDLEASRVVPLGPGVAYLLLPLVLSIGEAAKPSQLPWLVGVVAVETAEGWRIAALFTTTDKSA
ncbi:nuclear transport factor 2 family protein [Acuticoccus sediminis]|uniref:nuclear transport factor 2 family protein n=1 Tax=Acuticoccus sediminis TaxID=2184697 RepID=UPI001CFCDFB6|nr:nuclear transport factor 2 family protein [Acuticoccus sediminis]